MESFTKKDHDVQPELASLLSRSPSIFRARLHVCLLQPGFRGGFIVGTILPLLYVIKKRYPLILFCFLSYMYNTKVVK
jgi:hypothetical protein